MAGFGGKTRLSGRDTGQSKTERKITSRATPYLNPLLAAEVLLRGARVAAKLALMGVGCMARARRLLGAWPRAGRPDGRPRDRAMGLPQRVVIPGEAAIAMHEFNRGRLWLCCPCFSGGALAHEFARHRGLVFFEDLLLQFSHER